MGGREQHLRPARSRRARVGLRRCLPASHDGTTDVLDATLLPFGWFTGHGLALDANDGMATVESARWGEFLGCIPADHLDVVGQVGDEGPDPHTGFDHLRFYRNVAFDLAADGF